MDWTVFVGISTTFLYAPYVKQVICQGEHTKFLLTVTWLICVTRSNKYVMLNTDKVVTSDEGCDNMGWIRTAPTDVGVQSLSDAGNYHEFCRLLARLKSNYQLGEMVKVDNYPEVIKLIAEFTVTSLQVNIYYLVFFVCHQPGLDGHLFLKDWGMALW